MGPSGQHGPLNLRSTNLGAQTWNSMLTCCCITHAGGPAASQQRVCTQLPRGSRGPAVHVQAASKWDGPEVVVAGGEQQHAVFPCMMLAVSSHFYCMTNAGPHGQRLHSDCGQARTPSGLATDVVRCSCMIIQEESQASPRRLPCTRQTSLSRCWRPGQTVQVQGRAQPLASGPTPGVPWSLWEWPRSSGHVHCA